MSSNPSSTTVHVSVVFAIAVAVGGSVGAGVGGVGGVGLGGAICDAGVVAVCIIPELLGDFACWVLPHGVLSGLQSQHCSVYGFYQSLTTT